MEEVPRPHGSLLALDQQRALPREHEECLLIRLGVVEAGLPGLQDGDIEARTVWQQRSHELRALLPARAFSEARLAMENFDFDAAIAALSVS